jgi:hypothetical protein
VAATDITSGTNGGCGINCSAGAGYDLVTGVGSPISTALRFRSPVVITIQSGPFGRLGRGAQLKGETVCAAIVICAYESGHLDNDGRRASAGRDSA